MDLGQFEVKNGVGAGLGGGEWGRMSFRCSDYEINMVHLKFSWRS